MWLKTAPVVAAALLSSGLADTAVAGQTLRTHVFRNQALSRLQPGQPSPPAASGQPFSRLFPVPPVAAQPVPRPLPDTRVPGIPTAASRSADPSAPGQPRIACGTTVVPVDPAFDARIRKPAPVRPKPSARIVPTPPCD